MKKLCVFFAMVFACLIFASCKSDNNSVSTVNASIKQISSFIDDIYEIESANLILSDFMDKDSVYQKVNSLLYDESSVIIENLGVNDKFDTYVKKLYNLNNKVCSCVAINEQSKIISSEIALKLKMLKSMCDETDKNEKFKNSENSAVKQLSNNISTNFTKAKNSKIEIENNYNDIIKLKHNYSENLEELESSYIKLTNSLSSRNTYLTNILSCLNEYYNILSYYQNNKKLPEEDQTVIINLPATTDSEDNAVTQDKSGLYSDEDIKKYIDGVIDEKLDNSCGQNTEQNYGDLNYGNIGGYGYPYGYGFNNPYGMGMGYGGYGMPYGYGMGMGMPYGGFGWGNWGGNVTYRNIDTYKPIRLDLLYNQNNTNQNNGTFKRLSTKNRFGRGMFVKNIDTYKKHGK